MTNFLVKSISSIFNKQTFRRRLISKESLMSWGKILVIIMSEAVTWRCSVKKVFLEILQNSQENTRVLESLLNFADLDINTRSYTVVASDLLN